MGFRFHYCDLRTLAEVAPGSRSIQLGSIARTSGTFGP